MNGSIFFGDIYDLIDGFYFKKKERKIINDSNSHT